MTKNLDSILNHKLMNTNKESDWPKTNADLYKLHCIFDNTLYAMAKWDLLLYYNSDTPKEEITKTCHPYI